MNKPLRKAIFPVAGMGTRFLPATKATPKEMLPIVDKPLIQYAVEEAIEAGFTEMIFITSTTKRPIEDHFDSNFELETKLAAQKKSELLDIVQNILPKGISCAYVRQHEALGLGHAVLCAEPLINDEPFAVILADDLIKTKPRNCLKKMVETFQDFHHSILAVEAVPQDQTQRYGVVKPKENAQQDFFVIDDIVEKPKPQEAPSNLGVVGRYLLTPRIFHYLKTLPRGAGGEYQLTDAIAALLKEEPVGAMKIPSKRFDCGSKIGYLEATIAYGLAHPQLKDEFVEILNNWQSYHH
ncbi:MAG: UTP--glucose-phosphate uridylyltransferase [Gammaproteobacteria bacterium]|jgi:UTP--glucose-1-phosphate uridylyltransferase|nr:UTP--glucose-phosphate uridylyltransferase [Gammaproteobacteria bacterium]